MSRPPTTQPRRPTARQWLSASRPRTLPAAISPVLAGSALAVWASGFDLITALLALIVSVALQIGVNLANDYSDGIRGTDAERVGPVRLVGSGLAEPKAVRAAAFGCFGLACVAGLVIVVITAHWWLLAVGAACVLAAWFYTGGRHPYGYAGLGELFVFVFFGLVAVIGTVYVQVGGLPVSVWPTAVAIGLLSCGILVANNLRDIAGDRQAGKRTLATRLGDRGTRVLFLIMCLAAAAAVVAAALLSTWWALLGLIMIVPAGAATRATLAGATGHRLIGVLKQASLAELLCAVGLTAGMVLATLI